MKRVIGFLMLIIVGIFASGCAGGFDRYGNREEPYVLTRGFHATTNVARSTVDSTEYLLTGTGPIDQKLNPEYYRGDNRSAPVRVVYPSLNYGDPGAVSMKEVQPAVPVECAKAGQKVPAAYQLEITMPAKVKEVSFLRFANNLERSDLRVWIIGDNQKFPSELVKSGDASQMTWEIPIGTIFEVMVVAENQRGELKGQGLSEKYKAEGQNFIISAIDSGQYGKVPIKIAVEEFRK
ncbi:MAG: hypothetical protein WAV11_03175 [Minisyncoccia bacterium]